MKGRLGTRCRSGPPPTPPRTAVPVLRSPLVLLPAPAPGLLRHERAPGRNAVPGDEPDPTLPPITRPGLPPRRGSAARRTTRARARVNLSRAPVGPDGPSPPTAGRARPATVANGERRRPRHVVHRRHRWRRSRRAGVTHGGAPVRAMAMVNAATTLGPMVAAAARRVQMMSLARWAKPRSGPGQSPNTTVTTTHRAMATAAAGGGVNPTVV